MRWPGAVEQRTDIGTFGPWRPRAVLDTVRGVIAPDPGESLGNRMPAGRADPWKSGARMRNAMRPIEREEHRAGLQSGQVTRGAARASEPEPREITGRRWRYASAVQAARALQTASGPRPALGTT